jgi:hypothetical protein
LVAITLSCGRVPEDPIIEKTLEHLHQRRDLLKSSIADHRSKAEAESKELAKVEQALAGLRPLGQQTFLEKAGPVILTAGLMAIAALGATQAASLPNTTPSTSELIAGVLCEGGRLRDDEMLERMRALGWHSESRDELALIRSYLSRMVQRGTIKRVEPSTYELNVSNSHVDK